MKKPFSTLLSEYLEGTLPAGEAEEFFAQVSENKELLAAAIDERAAMDQHIPANTQRTERMLQRLAAALNMSVETRQVDTPEVKAPATAGNRGRLLPLLPRWRWVAAAAVITLAVGVYYTQTRTRPIEQANTAKSIHVPPGHDGAILTLDNGTQMVLDSLKNGVIAAQNGAKVLLQNGAVSYDAAGRKEAGAKEATIMFNTMTTPRGRQFRLTLPDGTKVWLNAESSIRYPTAFTGTAREVEMHGEAYFEVAKDPKLPFRLHVDGREAIDVLGTGFNVNAYTNEQSLNTTLIEGSIRVTAAKAETILKPGQQARLSESIKIINDQDLEKITAWKNGAFDFEGLGLDEAMRQLERWYDIKVRYEDGVPDIHFGGKIGRDVSLADLLDILAGTKLKFRMEKGRELIIIR